MVMTQTGLKINLLCLLITGVAVGLMQGAIVFLCCNFDDKNFPSFPAEKNVPRFRVKVIKQQQQHITMGQELFLLLFRLSSAGASNCLTTLDLA